MTEPASGEALIDVRGLAKTFRIGFFGRRVEAVNGVTFTVRRGEIFGFLGPNGAGKTTTIKMLTGLIAPSGGEAFLFGHRIPSPEARRRIGFLPENPYVYPYLTPREFVELSGRLAGLRGDSLRARAGEVLELVKIAYAADRPVRRLSKGMLQRTGLAAALVSNPEMLILDEPMSGLDPVGRKEVRDLIYAERDRGRTIFFSTHILSDVEAMCDRVAILRQGKVVVSGALRELLRGEVLATEIALANVGEGLAADLEKDGFKLVRRPDVVLVEIDGRGAPGSATEGTEGYRGKGDRDRDEDDPGAAATARVLQMALAGGAQVVEVSRRRETLEDLFLDRAL